MKWAVLIFLRITSGFFHVTIIGEIGWLSSIQKLREVGRPFKQYLSIDFVFSPQFLFKISQKYSKC